MIDKHRIVLCAISTRRSGISQTPQQLSFTTTFGIDECTPALGF